MISNEQELYNYMLGLIPDLKRADDVYSRYDFISYSQKAIYEVKARRKHYDELIIEKFKFDAVIHEAECMGYDPYYVSSTEKGVFAYNLKYIAEPSWERRLMPKTTDFSNNEKVHKFVGFLHIHDAERI